MKCKHDWCEGDPQNPRCDMWTDWAKSELRKLRKARKIDAFALAKELGPKISLNFNEWALIARAVEAQLKERK